MSLWKYIHMCVYVCINCVSPPAYLCMCGDLLHMFKTHVCILMCVYSFARTYAASNPQIKAWGEPVSMCGGNRFIW